MWYLIGLGNPGEKYATTRHNVGRFVLEQFAATTGSSWTLDKHARALMCSHTFGSKDVQLVLPETFMNRSGETVDFLLRKQSAQPNEIVVIHDDVDLPIGTLKISHGKGDGGHNGIRSIANALKSTAFVRVRVGIAPTSFWTGAVKRPHGGSALNRFVLGPFTTRERKKIEVLLPTITTVIETVIADGAAAAMNQFN